MKPLFLTMVFGLLIAMALPAAARKWTSSSGRFSTEAELVDFAEGKVRLMKPSGETIAVPLERLSQADRRFVLAAKKKGIVPKKDVVSYVKEVQPYLTTYCSECHNQNKAKDGYDVTSYAALLAPGKKGPLVVPGKPGESRLVLTHQGKGEFMPPAGSPQPTDEEVAKVSAWVEAGAPDDGIPPAQQKPRTGKGKSRR